MKNFNLLSKMCSPLVGSPCTDVSLDRRLTVGSPSVKCGSTLMRLVSVMAILLTVGVGNVWGQGTEDFEGFASSSTSYSTRSWTGKNGVSSWGATNARNDYSISGSYALTFKKDNSCTITMKLTTAQKNAGIGTLSFKYKYPVNTSDAGNTISVTLNSNTHSTSITNPGNTSTVKNGSITINETLSSTTVTINIGSGGRICIDDISWTAKPASCSANPTIGNASLNGSISLSSIPLSISSVGGGTDCTLAEYGFVWKASSAPSASDNKTKIGESSSATSFTGNITGSFSTGVTYYIKGYAINDGPNTTLSSTALQITPQSITFNSNGGSSVSTIYVNNGTAASAPTAPTKTGYTFGGWYTDNGTFSSAVNWSSTISENKTYYAKWTAKQCTVNFDIEGGTGTITNVTATYGQAMPSKESNLPTKTGYTFGGFWDGDDGTGTQYYNADGTSKINWNKDVTAVQTLYAKWTVQSYKVTWMVNGEEYTTGTPSSRVDFGSHVATLPTPPTPPCGNKFMGWTTTNIGSSGQATDAGLNLFTTAGGAPTISAEGDVTYYAVFADYGE